MTDAPTPYPTDAMVEAALSTWFGGGLRRDMRAAILAAERAAWSTDMESAPRDGTSILVRFYDGPGADIFDVWWDDKARGGWTDGDTDYDGNPSSMANPTAWRPMPAPHTPEASDEH